MVILIESLYTAQEIDMLDDYRFIGQHLFRIFIFPVTFLYREYLNQPLEVLYTFF